MILQAARFPDPADVRTPMEAGFRLSNHDYAETILAPVIRTHLGGRDHGAINCGAGD